MLSPHILGFFIGSRVSDLDSKKTLFFRQTPKEVTKSWTIKIIKLQKFLYKYVYERNPLVQPFEIQTLNLHLLGVFRFIHKSLKTSFKVRKRGVNIRLHLF